MSVESRPVAAVPIPTVEERRRALHRRHRADGRSVGVALAWAAAAVLLGWLVLMAWAVFVS